MSKLIKTDMKKALEKHLENCDEKIRRKAYKEGYEQGKFDARMKFIDDRPPTEQEVCEALGEYLGEEIVYEGFDLHNIDRTKGVCQFNLNTKAIEIYVELPPHLVEMIGKFYKVKVKE